MTTVAVIGVDIGTRSTKGIAVSATGELLAQSSVEHAVAMGRPGHFEQDAERIWWGDARAVLRKLTAALAPDVRIAAVGLSSCGPCIVPLSADGTPLRAGIMYGVDTRAHAEIQELSERWPDEVAIREFGMPFTSQSVWPKLQWLERNEPEVVEAASVWLNTNGYVAFRLTGAYAMDHHQASYLAPHYRNGAWAQDVPARWRSSFPDLLWSNEVVGPVSADAAEATGLPLGIPVILGSSDGMTAAIGAGVTSPGSAAINYGSTLGITAFASGDPGGPGVWTTAGNRPGEVAVIAALSTSGAITSWFREQFARELDQSNSAAVNHAHGVLMQEAEASPPGAGGILLLPHFAGERTPMFDPNARGVILGLGIDSTRGDVYRAILEGTAYGVRRIIEAIRAAGAEIDTLRAVGGGTAQPLWMQIVSDITGIRQELIEPSLGAPLGATRLAAESAGLVAVDDGAWCSVERRIKPDSTASEFYARRYTLFVRLYEQTSDLVNELAVLAAQAGNRANGATGPERDD